MGTRFLNPQMKRYVCELLKSMKTLMNYVNPFTETFQPGSFNRSYILFSFKVRKDQPCADNKKEHIENLLLWA